MNDPYHPIESGTKGTVDYVDDAGTLHAINSTRTKDLADNDLTSAQSETVLFYAEHDGNSIKELSEHLKVTHQAARKLVTKLCEKGILETQTFSEDKRFVNVHLTEKGLSLAERLKTNGTSIGEHLLTDLSADEKQTLYEFLCRIEKHIEE